MHTHMHTVCYLAYGCYNPILVAIRQNPRELCTGSGSEIGPKLRLITKLRLRYGHGHGPKLDPDLDSVLDPNSDTQ